MTDYRRLFACAVVAMILAALYSAAYYILNTEVRVVDNGQHPVEFWPLWTDNYEPIRDFDKWPWPIGPSKSQKEIIEQFDRAWIATLVPNVGPEDRRKHEFHRNSIVAFREVRESSEKMKLRSALIQCFGSNRPVGVMEEAYPEIGIRLQHSTACVDIDINLFYGLVHIRDKEEMTMMFFPKGSDVSDLITELSASLPRFGD